MQKYLIMQNLPTDFCHASTVVKLADNTFFACWFGGTKEGNPDVAIYSSRFEAGVWSVPCKLAAGAEANWNPVLYSKQDGTLVLFFKQGQKIAEWVTYVCYSKDGGKTWSKAVPLVPGDISGGRGPVRNKLLKLASGKLLAGCSTEQGLWKAYADATDEAMAAWQRSEPIEIENLVYNSGEKTAESNIAVSAQSFYGRGVIQPTLWESESGVHMLLRSSEGFVYRSDSVDEGKSWCSAYATELPNNNSGLDLVKAPFDGKLYLLCNPVTANWGVRSPLTLLASADDGQSWSKVLDLETAAGEFSYPAIIADQEGLYMTYTYDRKNIAFVEIKAHEL